MERLTQQALEILHWRLISEKRSERRLARQIMRQWLRVDEFGEVVWWRKPSKKGRPEPARKKPSWRERRQAARRARKSRARQKARDFLADLGAPLVLKPVPARMRQGQRLSAPPSASPSASPCVAKMGFAEQGCVAKGFAEQGCVAKGFAEQGWTRSEQRPGSPRRGRNRARLA